MSHTLPEVQEIIDYNFLNQKLDNHVKLDILYFELDRLEKTLEVRGTPFVFLDPDEVEITVQNGKRRYEEYSGWIAETIAKHRTTLPLPEELDKLDDLFNSLIDILWREDLHAMIILTLAQIVIVKGMDSYSRPNN
ncbi:MAG: hypothetical protein KAW09_07620 [Thermoplasmata archaeon]|nr:hypothetical protein [Thermoplasmata archaeon]